MNEWLGKLLGVDDLRAIHAVEAKFAAPWARHRPALLLFGCLLLAAVAAAFYLRYQPLTRWPRRVGMIALRGGMLVLLLVLLAEPVVSMTLTHHPRPLLPLHPRLQHIVKRRRTLGTVPHRQRHGQPVTVQLARIHAEKEVPVVPRCPCRPPHDVRPHRRNPIPLPRHA